ncbi:FadR/GntR family transcriptional regulator [Pseudorhodoferax sp.]|uniref:FadR/GntR family transcriptional regulator n=1 Tax=Pseudorhodoferax sp. TaxID=1993553 RepID=UPI0039E4E18D
MPATLLTDTVYEHVLALIRRDKLCAGDRLPGEHALAERFGVSRPVVRQALARLRAEGRVTATHGAGHFVGEEPEVKTIDYGPIQGIPDVRGFLEFRCILESESAALAARSRDARLRAAITARRKAMEAARLRGEPGIEEDIAFHAAIARASENRYLIVTIAALTEQTRIAIRLVRELSPQPMLHRGRDVRDEHLRIDEAIAARDADAAREAMTQHLRSGIARLFPRQA